MVKRSVEHYDSNLKLLGLCPGFMDTWEFKYLVPSVGVWHEKETSHYLTFIIFICLWCAEGEQGWNQKKKKDGFIFLLQCAAQLLVHCSMFSPCSAHGGFISASQAQVSLYGPFCQLACNIQLTLFLFPDGL